MSSPHESVQTHILIGLLCLCITIFYISDLSATCHLIALQVFLTYSNNKKGVAKSSCACLISLGSLIFFVIHIEEVLKLILKLIKFKLRIYEYNLIHQGIYMVIMHNV